jgi:hypothetical protein
LGLSLYRCWTPGLLRSRWDKERYGGIVLRSVNEIFYGATEIAPRKKGETIQMKLRDRVWEIVEVAKPGDRASRAFDIFILTLIFLNVLAVIVGTVESVE